MPPPARSGAPREAEPRDGRRGRITPGLDKLRANHGRGAVQPASLLGRDRTAARDGSDGPTRVDQGRLG